LAFTQPYSVSILRFSVFLDIGLYVTMNLVLTASEITLSTPTG